MFQKLQSISLGAAVLILALHLAGCAGLWQTGKNEQYQATYLDLFDTVTTVVGQAENEEAFRQDAQAIHDELLEYHQLFDIYNTYEGINNLKTINDQAGQEPVEVDARIIELLLDCKAFYEETDGRVNIAMGSVLKLWHEARSEGLEDPSNARLPDSGALEAAAQHMDISALIIDEETSTVYLSDPGMQLDVGAVAKGWATQKVAETVRQQEADRSEGQTAGVQGENSGFGYLISVGGNVCVTGAKDQKGTPWVVGIRNPNTSEEEYLHTLNIETGCVVTSADDQRTYMVDGKSYHHIIDPDTVYPSDHWRSVTILCEDSGIADMLSTALFLMDQESGQALLERHDAEAMWMDAEGNVYYSPDFQKLIRS